ncbi:uncharacterized protein KIAA2013 homolog isoform X2 [Bacillus rossius redtenbacheri]|uniref:uncharacterized protein KIAA2013 homolog isoform X2 n=1 Tax=Bacillus rossius redtenbacheri TaxID=93214 RepID=UPI002FDDCCE8
MDTSDIRKKVKRLFDVYFTFKRLCITCLVLLVLIWYFGPKSLVTRFSFSMVPSPGSAEKCLQDSLAQYRIDEKEFNVNIQHVPLSENQKVYLPYIGNGLFGLTLNADSSLYIRNGRCLSRPVHWHPNIVTTFKISNSEEAILLHYVTGMAHKYQCFSNGLSITSEHYAHRRLRSLLVQTIRLTNPTDAPLVVEFQRLETNHWSSFTSQVINLKNGDEENEYQVITGSVEASTSEVIAVSIVSRKMTQHFPVKPHSSVTIDVLTTVSYSKPVKKDSYTVTKEVVEKQAIENLKKALQRGIRKLREEHIGVWQQLWRTGLSISYSKAANVINGDKINATLYYVMSQVPSLLNEESVTKEKKPELATSLSLAEGCYNDRHTLRAVTLWNDLSTIDEINAVVSVWLITLEKRGCHNLLTSGAVGTLQAMVLSFGGFRFSNKHLEFHIHPKYLHRDYFFRRISYGNTTLVNVSVVVQEDNKAIIYASLDQHDTSYYACDGGCLDDPVQLGWERKWFPVKLTDPVTAVLYISHDRKHLEEMHHAIHVKEVVEDQL